MERKQRPKGLWRVLRKYSYGKGYLFMIFKEKKEAGSFWKSMLTKNLIFKVV